MKIMKTNLNFSCLMKKMKMITFGKSQVSCTLRLGVFLTLVFLLLRLIKSLSSTIGLFIFYCLFLWILIHISFSYVILLKYFISYLFWINRMRSKGLNFMNDYLLRIFHQKSLTVQFFFVFEVKFVFSPSKLWVIDWYESFFVC